MVTKTGDTELIDDLIQSLDNARSVTRSASATTLGEIGAQAATTALMKNLTDQSPWVRSRAAEALGHIGNIDAIDGLQVCLEDKNLNVRRVAINALGELGATSAIPRIVSKLSDKRFRVIRAAADTLAKLGAASAVPELRKLERHEDDTVARSAKEAVFRLKNHPPISVAPDAMGASFQVSMLVSEPLRANTWSALNVRVLNTGRGPAIDVRTSLEGDWGGEEASLGGLKPGESRSGVVRLRPKSAGQEVPITLIVRYRLVNGMRMDLQIPHLVSVRDEAAQVFQAGGDIVFPGGVNAPGGMAIAQGTMPQFAEGLGLPINPQIGAAWHHLFQNFKDGESSLRIRELEVKMRLQGERIEQLSKVSADVLIAVSDEKQGELIAMLNEMRELQGFSPQQLLAKGAVDNPEFATAYGDLLLAVAANDQTEQYERLIEELKSSASNSHDDYDRNLETLLEMFHKALDSIRDMAIAART